MKIALIHSHLNDRGGSQRYVIEIANTLRKLGIEIDIFCYEYNQKSCYPELTQNLDIYKLYTRENDATLNDSLANKNGLLKTALKLLYKNSIVKNIDLSKVFIVHGHDDGLKIEVCRYLEKLNIKPIILHEQVNKGQTIIEKIESNTNVGFGIALYTSCDIGGKDKENLNNRARQNVVFEHGYLIGKLTRKRVVALVKEDSIETPGDMSGVVYISYNSNWQFDIAKELKSAGYSIDLNKLMEERCIEK